ncbi:MAG: VWA domain-containing protein [Candidatus Phosphoribacter sp.]
MSTEVAVVGTEDRDAKIVMPFYIILDLSGSMVGDFSAMEKALEDIIHGVMADFVASDFAMLSIIGFGSGAHTLVPLGPASDMTAPTLHDMGGTNFSAAFTEFHRSFNADRLRLKNNGDRVFRPCVFFLTDGAPGDSNWHSNFLRDLGYDPRTGQGNKNYPFVVAYGFRDAKEEVMRKLAYPNFGEKQGVWYFTRSTDVATILKAIVPMIANSVVSSGQSVPTGSPSVFVPTPIAIAPGATSGLPDELE